MTDCRDVIEHYEYQVQCLEERIEQLEAQLAQSQLKRWAARWEEQADRIEKLEAALREIIGALDDPKGGQHVYDMRNASYIARKALEGKDD